MASSDGYCKPPHPVRLGPPCRRPILIATKYMLYISRTLYESLRLGPDCVSADRRRGVVILSNTSSSVDDLGFAVLVDGAPLEPVRQSITLPTSSLDEYVGTYKLDDKFLLKIVRIDNQLYGRGTGQSA